LGYQR